ncbi:uncharacterized protein [Temnothorax longispinosus]|uniref:uncharacterized protein n=1 Tax=Temnothorax longispinosus TaxID=300112 RepID=UPI003A998C02
MLGQDAGAPGDAENNGNKPPDVNINTRGLAKRLSASNLSALDRSCNMNASRVNAMRQSINNHHDNVAKILLACKESKDRKAQIDSAFRFCKEAFLEFSTAYLSLLDGGGNATPLSGDLKSFIGKAITEGYDSLQARTPACNCSIVSSESRLHGGHAVPSYASVVETGQSRVRMMRGPTLDVPKTTNLIITPEEESAGLASSRDTRIAVQRILKPSDYNLKVKRISSTKNSGVRIEAHSVDFDKMKHSKVLERAGLRLEQENKVNPRLLVQGIPCDMNREDIKSEIIALNLKDISQNETSQIKIVYIYPPRDKRKTTNCVVEVSASIRAQLLKEKHVFVNYFACKVSDHIKVLQCFKCLAFGHFAKHCRFSSLCGHCAKAHEMKDCEKRKESPVCGNCKRWTSHEEPLHSALDSKHCPILRRRIADRINSINYG